MSKVKNNIRSLILSPMAGFRTCTVKVAEWKGAEIKLREPSGKAWVEWREVMQPKEGGDQELTASQIAHRNMQADIILFTDVLLDEDDSPIFSDADRAEIEQFYGPVHTRLLNQALGLSSTQADAEKK